MLLLLLAVLSTGAVCKPTVLLDPPGPPGWGQVVRLRHLYATRKGVHLQIGADGEVSGSPEQSLYSLLEIRSVSPGCVVLRGVTAARFLCMEGDGRLFSSVFYSRENCTFRELLLADGYSAFLLEARGTLLSLGTPQQRQTGRDRDSPALAQFLPRIGVVDPTVPPEPDQSSPLTDEPLDVMDAFAKLTRIIHSPSFHTR